VDPVRAPYPPKPVPLESDRVGVTRKLQSQTPNARPFPPEPKTPPLPELVASFFSSFEPKPSPSSSSSPLHRTPAPDRAPLRARRSSILTRLLYLRRSPGTRLLADPCVTLLSHVACAGSVTQIDVTVSAFALSPRRSVFSAPFLLRETLTSPSQDHDASFFCRNCPHSAMFSASWRLSGEPRAPTSLPVELSRNKTLLRLRRWNRQQSFCLLPVFFSVFHRDMVCVQFCPTLSHPPRPDTGRYFLRQGSLSVKVLPFDESPLESVFIADRHCTSKRSKRRFSRLSPSSALSFWPIRGRSPPSYPYPP